MRALIAVVVVAVVLAAAGGTAASNPSEAGWQLQQLPGRYAGSELDGISCASDTACIALADGPSLAVRFDGNRWSGQRTPIPPVVFAAGFPLPAGVSCSSQASCTIVWNGFYMPYAERWDGSKWSARSLPSRGSGTMVQAVSCAARNACIAVGNSGRGFQGPSDLITVRWNGRRWILRTAPEPTPSSDGQLNGISCASPTMCMAVGFYSTTTSHLLPLAERWNGKRWLIEKARRGGVGNDTDLSGVSCPTRTMCVAVGTFGDSGIAEFWNGSSWSLGRTPTSLTSISCFSPRECLGVGQGPSSGPQAIGIASAAWWNGTRWSVLNPIQPQNIASPNLSGIAFTGVSCPSSTTCFAVGAAFGPSGGNSTPFAERWTPPGISSPQFTG